MATRRRRKVTWLPVLGSTIGEGDGTTNGFNWTVSAPTNGGIGTVVRSVTFDEPRDIDTFGTDIISMADAIGSEYMLHRIVGKVFANRIPETVLGDPDDEVPLLVAAGFFVARAADGDQSVPIGASTAVELRDNYSPLEVDTVREPWIWRRAWILGLAGTVLQAGGGAGNPLTAIYPATNTAYGSALDGPHIDARTRRRVGNDERLWFAASACNWPVNTLSTSTVFASGYVDLRLVGQILRARNRGVF